MTVAVRTRPLVRVQVGVTTAADLLFTCPTDRVAIVKDARISAAGVAGTTRLVVARFGTVGALELVSATYAGTKVYAAANPLPYVVMGEGDTLYLLSTVGMLVDVWVSGALLDGDPA